MITPPIMRCRLISTLFKLGPTNGFNPLKSESMLVSLRSNNGNGQNFIFQKNVINKVDTHKHLGLTWNSDASWKSHMSTVISKASKRIDMLRSLKLKLDRSSLEKMYFAYIRPIFEYASVLGDSAPRHDYYFTTIEKLQISAARIVTGTIHMHLNSYCPTIQGGNACLLAGRTNVYAYSLKM